MTYSASGFADVEWFYDIDSMPNSFERMLLTLFDYCGYIGNNIFFVCSAWFLLEKKQNRKIKILQLELDVWIISVIYLVIFLLSRNVHLNGATILRSIFPTTFNNNWFVTAYMLFYFAFPGLNRLIENISREKLEFGCLFFALLICIFMPFFQEWSDFKFYFSYPMMWVLVYFCIAYLKTYHMDLISSRKFGVLTLVGGLLGVICQICATYYFGRYSFVIRGSGMRWYSWHNPFLWMIAFGSFSLFRTMHFHSKTINRISSLSLLVYLIHENYLVREHWRPYLYIIIHNQFHNKHVAACLFLFAAFTFVISSVLALVYKKTVQPIVYRASDRVYKVAKRLMT